jgi:hypothetical protein
MKLARHPDWNDFPENVFDFSAHRVLSQQPKEVFGMSLPMRNLNGKNVDRSVLEGITPGFRNTVQIFPRDIHALSNGRSPLRSGEPNRKMVATRLNHKRLKYSPAGSMPAAFGAVG